MVQLQSVSFPAVSEEQHQIPRPVAKDEERLARKKDDMPPQLPRRSDNPRIREDPSLIEFYSKTDKIHHAGSEAGGKRWTVSQVNVPVQHSLQRQWVLSNGRVNSENHRIGAILLPKKKKGTMSPICHFFASFGETTMHMWCWQLRPTVCQQMQGNYCKIMAWWDATQRRAIICLFMQELTAQDMFDSCGHRMMKRQRFTCGNFWSEVWPKVGRITHRFAWANSWYTFQWSGIC